MTTEAEFRATILLEAKKNLGHKYRDSSVPTNWPPEQFDCSVFTHWCCSKAGIDIDRGNLDATWPQKEPRPWRKYPGYTLTQQDTLRDLGAQIPFADIKPGDLLYYDRTDGSQHHVVMYLGGGMVIHAAGTAYGVIVSPVVPPNHMGHGGKFFTMAVSVTKAAKAMGFKFTVIPKTLHVVRVGGRTPIKVEEAIRQCKPYMSQWRFLKHNPKWRDVNNPDEPADKFITPGTPLKVDYRVTRIDASNNSS